MLLLFVGLLLSATLGSAPIPAVDAISIVLHNLLPGLLPGPTCPGDASRCATWVEIVWGARVPALLLMLLAGGALGLSGATLQGVFRNPLADPYLLGLSSGAALGASVVFTFDLHLVDPVLLLPIAAFLGGLVPGTIVYLAARRRARAPEVLLLTGVALNAFFSAILAALLLYNPIANTPVNFWLLGGANYASWTHDALLLAVLLAVAPWLALAGDDLNLLQMGGDVTQSLGRDPRQIVTRSVLLTTLLTAAAVAFTGIVGFVGLIAPHIVRRIAGPDYRRLLPLSALVGGGFLVAAFDVSLSVVPKVVIPVGIPTSFVGALFFIYLLYRRREVPGGGAGR